MTMQIALVGASGIVLASDTRWANNETTVRHTGGASKINSDKSVAIACARRMAIATRIADDLFDEFADKDWALVQLRSVEIAARVLDAAPRRSANDTLDFQCLIVTTNPSLAAYHLCGGGVMALQTHPTCQQIGNCQIAGDHINPAVCWSERYYWRSRLPDGLREVRQLVPLAAHLILSAAQLNRDSIDGLEIVIGDKGGVRRLPDGSIEKLRSDSESWDRQIEQFFASYPRIPA